MTPYQITVTVLVIVIVGLVISNYYSDHDDDNSEPYRPCPEYGCPAAKGEAQSKNPPRGNVVLNEFYYPYGGAPYFEHDANDVTLQPPGPAFIAESFNSKPLAAKAEPDHVPMSR